MAQVSHIQRAPTAQEPDSLSKLASLLGIVGGAAGIAGGIATGGASGLAMAAGGAAQAVGGAAGLSRKSYAPAGEITPLEAARKQAQGYPDEKGLTDPERDNATSRRMEDLERNRTQQSSLLSDIDEAQQEIQILAPEQQQIFKDLLARVRQMSLGQAEV